MSADPWSRVRAWRDRVRGSLFLVPMVFVAAGVLLAEAMLAVDGSVRDVPDRLTATVDSGRAVLTVVASATLAFAGVAFSVALLLISQASSQYSPRVVHGLFRDPVTRRVMGVVIGTFTYCLVVLRAVRGPLDGDGEAVIPSLSMLVAVVLGVAAILSTVAFISHSAHSLDVSEVLHRVTAEALVALPPATGDAGVRSEASAVLPTTTPELVRSAVHGWVQQIDHSSLLDHLPEGTVVQVLTAPGRYAMPGAPLARVWRRPAGPDEPPPAQPALAETIRGAIRTGPARTLLDDPTYGVRQLADVALRALSPGVHDPTTAHDALVHLAVVLRAVLVTEPAPAVLRRRGREVVLTARPTPADLVALAFDEVRLAAIGQPDVLVGMLEVLAELEAALPPDAAAAHAALRRQAGLVLACADLGEVPGVDRRRVRDCYEEHWADAARSNHDHRDGAPVAR